MSLWRRIYVEYRAIVLPLLVFLAANVAVLALAVLPLQQGVKSAENESIDATLHLAQARQAAKSAKDAASRKDQAVGELRKFYEQILPLDYPTARNVLFVWAQNTAAASRLRFKGGVIDFDPVKDSRLVKVIWKVTLSGDYPDIRKFLYDLETAQSFVIVERVELEQSMLTNAATGQLNIVLNVATYYQAAAQAGGQ
jgi:Tfp pilus assembly protein PilO